MPSKLMKKIMLHNAMVCMSVDATHFTLLNNVGTLKLLLKSKLHLHMDVRTKIERKLIESEWKKNLN